MSDVFVKRYTPGDPVGEDEEPVRAQFSIMDAVRVELVPLNEELTKQVYVVFRKLGLGPDDPTFKKIREITKARTNNLWYRVVDGGHMEMEMNEDAIAILEQALQVMEDATTSH